jgi:hypothetical protein
VLQWDDQSGNNRHATNATLPGGGQSDPVYPGPLSHTFTNGVNGIDFAFTDAGGAPQNGGALQLLPAGADQDALLDFAGAAAGKSGFSVYIVYHPDNHLAPFNPEFNYLLGNAAFPNNPPSGRGMGIWFNSAGFVWGGLGAAGGDAFAGFVPPSSETIISMNYDAVTGNWTIANTNNGPGSGVGVGNNAAADFSGTGTSGYLALGSSTHWANFRADGDVGEVVIYDRYISPLSAEHLDTIDSLARKWFVPEPSSLALFSVGLLASLATRRRRN